MLLNIWGLSSYLTDVLLWKHAGPLLLGQDQAAVTRVGALRKVAQFVALFPRGASLRQRQTLRIL